MTKKTKGNDAHKKQPKRIVSIYMDPDTGLPFLGGWHHDKKWQVSSTFQKILGALMADIQQQQVAYVTEQAAVRMLGGERKIQPASHIPSGLRPPGKA